MSEIITPKPIIEEQGIATETDLQEQVTTPVVESVVAKDPEQTPTDDGSRDNVDAGGGLISPGEVDRRMETIEKGSMLTIDNPSAIGKTDTTTGMQSVFKALYSQLEQAA